MRRGRQAVSFFYTDVNQVTLFRVDGYVNHRLKFMALFLHNYWMDQGNEPGGGCRQHPQTKLGVGVCIAIFTSCRLTLSD